MLILGVGNLLLSDEGIGVRVIEDIVRRYRLPREVRAVDGGTLGMALLDLVADADYLMVVDAVRAGRLPGEIVRLEGEDIPAVFQRKLSPHQVGLSEVFATLRLMGKLPGKVLLIGIEPASLQLGMELSPEVAARLPELVKTVMDELFAIGLDAVPAGGFEASHASTL